jgi:hypothetical protein
MTVTRTTSVMQTAKATGTTPATDAQVRTLVDNYVGVFKNLIRNSGLVKMTGQTGEMNWDAASTVTAPASNAWYDIGYQWWKLGGDRATQEPIHFKIILQMRRQYFNNTYVVQISPRFEVGVLNETSGVWVATSVDFGNMPNWPSLDAWEGPMQMCVRDNSLTVLMPISTTNDAQYNVAARGWMHVARALESDATTPSDTHILLYVNAPYRNSSASGSAVLRSFKHSANAWTIWRAQFPGLFAAFTSSSTGATTQYTTAMVATPWPLFMKNFILAYTQDVAPDNLHTLRMIDGNLGTFYALPANASPFVNPLELGTASGAGATTALLRWE